MFGIGRGGGLFELYLRNLVMFRTAFCASGPPDGQIYSSPQEADRPDPPGHK